MASVREVIDASENEDNTSVTQNVDTVKISTPEDVESDDAKGVEERQRRGDTGDLEASSLVPDDSDALGFGTGPSITDVRPEAVMSVKRDAHWYNMKHKRRGRAIIFAHENFITNHSPRFCARHDASITKEAFKRLGFEVMIYPDCTKDQFLKILKEVSLQNHQENDCLVVVFMSHGGVNKYNKEYLCTYDDQVNTEELWRNFTADKCPTLAGKPKLFFIQACRGENSDKGVTIKKLPKALSVQTDYAGGTKDEYVYVIPLHTDMLIMWASYPGMYAFNSSQGDIRGSVFLHYLTNVLNEDGKTCDLFTLLLRVTREVATQYESYSPKIYDRHQNKQTPYMVSTLMRNLKFFM